MRTGSNARQNTMNDHTRSDSVRDAAWPPSARLEKRVALTRQRDDNKIAVRNAVTVSNFDRNLIFHTNCEP
jgi:hypothetical protein